MTFRRFFSTCLVALCVARAVPAADGSLDPTFGSGGKVTTGFGEATALAFYPDGRLLLGGGGGTFVLARFHADGTPDTTFGSGGVVATSGEGERNVSDLVILPDERIIAVGYAQDGFEFMMRLIRYHPDGSLDTTYGTGGKVTAHFAGGAVSGRAALQPDGKLLDLAINKNGGGVTYALALARFEADGTPDAGFGSGGQVVTDFPGGGEYGTDLLLAPDGKFYVVGVSATDSSGGYDNDWLIVRYNADGSLDTAYGNGGRITETFATGYVEYERAAGAALQPDGKLVVGGDSGALFALARYLPDGTLDGTFGNGGKVTMPGFPQVEAAGMVRQPDGKLVLAATGYRAPEDVFSPRGFALTRFTAGGSVDGTFAPCPQVSTGLGTENARARTIGLQPDGKPVVVGGLESGALAMARYGAPSTPVCQPATSGRSSVSIRDSTTPARDLLKWTWRGEPVSLGDLGDPTGGTGYTLCVVDQSGGAPTLRLGSPMMRTDWSAGTTGYTFASAADNDFPFRRVKLQIGGSGTGKFTMNGQGEYLHPGLPLTAPVTVRLVRDDSDTCWEATYAIPRQNDGARFVAKSD